MKRLLSFIPLANAYSLHRFSILGACLKDYLNQNPCFATLFWILLGSGVYFLSAPIFICILLFLIITVVSSLDFIQRKFFLLYAISLTLFGNFYSLYRDTPHFATNIVKQGSGIFCVSEKKESTLFGKKSLVYKGVLTQFTDAQGKVYKSIPCTLRRPLHAPLWSSDQIFLENLELSIKDKRQFSIKIPTKFYGAAIGKHFSFAHKRYKAKMTIFNHLQKRYEDKKTFAFISAMATGYIDHKTLMYEFSKTGIQHLLTISGFHFSLLALFLSAILKPCLPKKIFIASLVGLLSLYVLYLGPSPSVSRSWVAAVLMLIAYFYEIPTNPINYLSCAGILAFLDNPLCLTQLGFQLSYLATFGILAYFRLCDHMMQFIFPSRSSATLFSFSNSKQLFCLCMILIRKSLALDNAVNLITLPVIFYHFESFPLFSFFFNLIIPLLLLPSLYLLIIGLLCTPLRPLETTLHAWNHAYTKCILDYVASCPKVLETTITLKNITATASAVAVMMIFLFLLMLNKDQRPFKRVG